MKQGGPVVGGAAQPPRVMAQVLAVAQAERIAVRIGQAFDDFEGGASPFTRSCRLVQDPVGLAGPGEKSGIVDRLQRDRARLNFRTETDGLEDGVEPCAEGFGSGGRVVVRVADGVVRGGGTVTTTGGVEAESGQLVVAATAPVMTEPVRSMTETGCAAPSWKSWVAKPALPLCRAVVSGPAAETFPSRAAGTGKRTAPRSSFSGEIKPSAEPGRSGRNGYAAGCVCATPIRAGRSIRAERIRDRRIGAGSRWRP